MSASEIRQILEEDAAAPRFDGTVAGWRLAGSKVLRAEGSADRGLSRTCSPRAAGGETATDLDFVLTYFPPDLLAMRKASPPVKWLCGEEALSVMVEYGVQTPYGVGDVWVERAVWGQRSLSLSAASDRVEEGSINGHPAIFVHPADDESGLGQGQIIVLEDDRGPEFRILRIAADNGIPFAELLRIAEGIR